MLGLLSFIAGPLTGIPAFIIGVKELWKISAGLLGTAERARITAGILASIIGTAVFSLLIFFTVITVSPRHHGRRERNRSPIVRAPMVETPASHRRVI